jgi:lambda family phage tail tape measure protein
MAGSMQTRITITADDKASDVFRKVGDAADKSASRILGVGASAARAFRSVDIDILGGSDLAKFAQQMSVLTSQVGLLRKETNGAFAEFKSSLVENIALIGRDTQAYIVNTQAAIANGRARLDYLDQAITANKVLVAEIQQDKTWKWKPADRTAVNEILKENNELIAEQSRLSNQLVIHQNNLNKVTASGTGRFAALGKTFNLVKGGAASLINFLGGPWAVGIAAAIAAIGYLASSDTAAEKSAKSYGLTLEEIEKRYQGIISGADEAAKATLGLSAVFRQAQQEWYGNLRENIDKARADVDKLIQYTAGSYYEPFAGIEIKNVYGVDDATLKRLQDINSELQNGSITAQEAEIKIHSLLDEVKKADGSSGFIRILEQIGVHLSFIAQKSDIAKNEIIGLFSINQATKLSQAIDAVQFKIDQLGRTKAAQSLFDTAKKEGIDVSKISINSGVVSVADNAATREQIQLLQTLHDKEGEYSATQDRINKQRKETNSAIKDGEAAIKSLSDEIAKLTMTEQEYARYQYERKFAELRKDMGATSPALAEWARLQEMALGAGYTGGDALATHIRDVGKAIEEMGMDEKQKQIHAVNEEFARLFAYMDQGGKTPFTREQAQAVQAQQVREAGSGKKDAQLLVDFEKEFLTIIQGSEAAQIASIRERAAAYEEAGADAVRVAQWTAEQELKYSRKATDGMKRGLKEWGDEALNVGQNMESVMKDAFTGMSNAFSFTTAGMKVEWGSLIDDIINKTAHAMIIQPLAGALASGLSSFAGSFFTAHSGGVVGRDAMQRSYAPSWVFAGAMRYHSGGSILAPGEVPIIAQYGERVLTREENAAYERGKTGAPINLVVELKNESGQRLETKSQQTQWSGDMKNAVVSIVLDAVNRNYMGARDALRG